MDKWLLQENFHSNLSQPSTKGEQILFENMEKIRFWLKESKFSWKTLQNTMKLNFLNLNSPCCIFLKTNQMARKESTLEPMKVLNMDLTRAWVYGNYTFHISLQMQDDFLNHYYFLLKWHISILMIFFIRFFFLYYQIDISSQINFYFF